MYIYIYIYTKHVHHLCFSCCLAPYKGPPELKPRNAPKHQTSNPYRSNNDCFQQTLGWWRYVEPKITNLDLRI